MKKDFREFRRSIDQINLNLAAIYFKNSVLEDPKDARVIKSEAKRQWTKGLLTKAKKHSKSSADLAINQGPLTEYTDSQHTLHPPAAPPEPKQLTIAFNPLTVDKLDAFYRAKNAQIRKNKSLTSLDPEIRGVYKGRIHFMGEDARELIPSTLAKIIRPQKETGEVKVSRLIKLGRLVE